MALGILPFDPVRDSYNFNPGYSIIRVDLDGGAARYRNDVVGKSHIITVQWIIVKNQYSKFTGFFRDRIRGGSSAFKMNLLSDAEIVMPHVCHCIDSLPQLIEQKGEMFRMQAVLEVTPNPTKSFDLFLQNVSVAQFVDAGNSQFPTGDLSEFPTGRQVILTGTSVTLEGNDIDLDGTYTIDTAPNGSTRTLLNAATVNSDWTVLNGTSSQSYFPANGAAILIPE